MSNTLTAIKSIAPKYKVNVSEIADTIDTDGHKYGLNSDKRTSAFISQAAHETDGFKSLKEYASGAAYEGRADLGNTQPGDGVKFKGRGIFMYTGRANYRDVSRHLFGDDRLLNNPEILEQPKYAALSAMYYWKSRGLNELADVGTEEAFKTITRRINGGLNGWADRLRYWDRAKLFFSTTRK